MTQQSSPRPAPRPDLWCRVGRRLGVAVFRGGRTALIVFDQPITIDISPLRDDPIFGSASVQTLQTATVIRLPLDPTMALSPSRTRDAWRITAVPLEPTLRPIQAAVVDDRLVLRAVDVGTVISLVDPDTGATLLVGTQRRNGQGVPVLRQVGGVHPAADLAGRGGGTERRYHCAAANASRLHGRRRLHPLAVIRYRLTCWWVQPV